MLHSFKYEATQETQSATVTVGPEGAKVTVRAAGEPGAGYQVGDIHDAKVLVAVLVKAIEKHDAYQEAVSDEPHRDATRMRPQFTAPYAPPKR